MHPTVSGILLPPKEIQLVTYQCHPVLLQLTSPSLQQALPLNSFIIFQLDPQSLELGQVRTQMGDYWPWLLQII